MDPNTSQNLLNRYILDYFKTRGFNNTAASFAIEAKLSDEPPPPPPKIGGICGCWATFYDFFISNLRKALEERSLLNRNVEMQLSSDDESSPSLRLHRYILDYFKRRGFDITADSFEIEAKLSGEPPPPPVFEGLLSDWWNIFYKSYISRTWKRLEEDTSLNRNVSSNSQTQTPTNQQPLNVAEQSQSAVQDDQNDDLDTDVIIISSSSDELQTSSSQEEDSLSIPRGIPLTHFLDEFPKESESSKLESSLPKKQGTSKVPVKVFRGKSRQHQTTGQLRLKPKSNKDGEVAKDDMPIEKDDLVSDEYHPSQVENGTKGGFSFKEVVTFFTSNDKVSVWNVESLSHLGNTPQQLSKITDVRFKPHSTVFATSSFYTTIRLWDAANVSKLVVELDGHGGRVISVDFNPYEPKIVCSHDCNGEIRLWDINDLACISVYKVDGGMRKLVRFLLKNLVAVTSGNMILLIDIEINRMERLKGHARDIRSICRDQSGSYLASVSENSARVWSRKSGWKCDYELYSTDDNIFQSCTFHPLHSLLLVIGGFQIIEFWDCVEGSKTRSIKLHEGIISALTYSPEAGLFASTSNDGHIRLWR